METLIVLLVLSLGGYGVGSWHGWRRARHWKGVLNERNEELQAARTELARLSALDGLTQLATQQYFQEFLEREWRRSLRELMPISLIIIDLDHFNTYNQRLGHEAGDGCLKRVADALRSVVGRPGDVVARYGPEEFAIVLGRTDATGATALASRFQAAVAALKLPHPASPAGKHVTVSLGVATAIPNRGATWQEIELVAAAERALLDAKNLGRNRVASAEFQPA